MCKVKGRKAAESENAKNDRHCAACPFREDGKTIDELLASIDTSVPDLPELAGPDVNELEALFASVGDLAPKLDPWPDVCPVCGRPWPQEKA
jgi:hypothetical protein